MSGWSTVYEMKQLYTKDIPMPPIYPTINPQNPTIIGRGSDFSSLGSVLPIDPGVQWAAISHSGAIQTSTAIAAAPARPSCLQLRSGGRPVPGVESVQADYYTQGDRKRFHISIQGEVVAAMGDWVTFIQLLDRPVELVDTSTTPHTVVISGELKVESGSMSASIGQALRTWSAEGSLIPTAVH